MDRRKEDWAEPPLGAEEGVEPHLSDAELLGESEYSRRLAGGGESEQEPGADQGSESDELAVAPEDLGRRALADATQSPPREAEQAERGQRAASRRHFRRGERRAPRGQ